MQNFFASLAPLTEKDLTTLAGITRSLELRRGSIWIKAGEQNREIGLVQSGCLRRYYVKDGEEITDYFYFANDFTGDLASILSGNAPAANIVALQPTMLYTFSYDDFIRLCVTSPRLEHLYRLMLEKTFVLFYERSVSFITNTPQQRYNRLIASRPDIMQLAAVQHVASYLGITTQHLSRIRAGN